MAEDDWHMGEGEYGISRVALRSGTSTKCAYVARMHACTQARVATYLPIYIRYYKMFTIYTNVTWLKKIYIIQGGPIIA